MILKVRFFWFFFFFSIFSFSQKKIFSLDECFVIATKNNYDFKNSKLDSLRSSLRILQSKGEFLPTGVIGVSNNYDFGTTINPSSNIREPRNRNTTSGTFSVNWVVFDGLKRIYGLRISKLNHLIEIENSKKIKAEIFTNILNSYTDVLFNNELELIEKNNLIRNQQLLDFVNEKINLGSEIKVNYQAIETRILKTKLNINKFRNESELSSLNLASLLGIDESIEIKKIDSILNNEKSPNFNFDSIPEIRILKLSMDKELLNFKSIKSNYYPRISFRYSINSFYSHTLGKDDVLSSGGDIIDSNYNFIDQFNGNKGHYLGINLSLPIFGQFKNSTNSKISKYQSEKLKNDYENRKKELNHYFKKLEKEILIAKEEYEYQQKYLTSLNEVLVINEEKYKLGLVSLFDLDNLYKDYEVEQINLLNLKVRYFYTQKILEISFSSI